MKKKYVAAGLCLAAVVCLGAGIYMKVQEDSAGREYDGLKEEVLTSSSPEETPEATAQAAATPVVTTPEAEKASVVIPIDFAALQQINPDAYAWIRIPGTAIDYPVLQREGDNSYYLDHTAEGTQAAEGAIFTEDYNTKTFEDVNTVIYGHDMKNGTMFQNLLKYKDRSFFDQNREVIIYLPDKILHYQIFAAYVYDDRHLMESINFDDKEIYQKYLDRIFSTRDMSASIDTDMEVAADDRIVTLSTCNAADSETRYLVQAVLISIDE